MAAKTKAITVRLPDQLYRRGADAAKRKKVSLNRLMQEGLEAVIKAEEDRELYDAFTVLGQDPESDVEYMMPLVAEVLERDEQSD